jgi:hypothetical protein
MPTHPFKSITYVGNGLMAISVLALSIYERLDIMVWLNSSACAHHAHVVDVDLTWFRSARSCGGVMLQIYIDLR